MGMLAQAGAELTPNAEDADVIVVNTCSFIGSAQQESIDTILEMARQPMTKTGGKAKRLVVAGCLVERFHDEIRKNIPEVDAVVGTGELEKILAAAGLAETPRAPSPFNILTSNAFLTSRPEGDHRREQGRFARDSWDGAVADLPNYLYDDHTPRVLTSAEIFGLYQNCRRLRSSLQLLHHSATSRTVSLAAFRIRHRRSRAAGAIRRTRNHAHRTGHHLLRRGPWTERWPGPAAGKACGRRRPAVDSLPLRLSQQNHGAAA